MKLKISDELSFPLDAATQTFAWLGRKGSGKTYGSSRFAELLLEARVQIVVLDQVGNWFGLRLGADGKSKGFDVPVLGGLRGDIPLEASGGGIIADTIVDTGRSFVLDVSQFSFEDRRRFSTALAVQLWQRKKAEQHPIPLHLFLEECQLVVPQKVDGANARMVGIFEEIVRLGRNFGIGASMISQRPQSVNKEVLNMAEPVMAFQMTGPQERETMRKWMTHAGVNAKLADELPSLPQGTPFCWSPQWLNVMQKITISAKVTADTSGTPKVGAKVTRRDPAPLDMARIKERMKASIEAHAANDPAMLKKRVADLERQIKAAKPPPAPAAKIVEKAVLKDGQIKRLENAIVRFEATAALIAGIRSAIAQTTSPSPTVIQRPIAPSPRPKNHRSPRVPSGETVAAAAGSLRLGERKILTAIAQHGSCTREQLTVLTGYKRSSRDTYLQKLGAAGFVDVGRDAIVPTDAGLKELGDYEALPTGDALLRHWLQRLPAGQRAILEFIVGRHPDPVERDAISQATGYLRSSRDTYLQKLGAKRLVEFRGPGLVQASDALFG